MSASDPLAQFQAVVLAQNRKRQRFGELAFASHRAHGANPLCGDSFKVALNVVDGSIVHARFHGEMSAISIAAGEILCALIESLSLVAGERLLRDALALLLDTAETAFDNALPGNEFQCFAILRLYPNRLKTATLPAATLLAAVLGDLGQVCTEG